MLSNNGQLSAIKLLRYPMQIVLPRSSFYIIDRLTVIEAKLFITFIEISCVKPVNNTRAATETVPTTKCKVSFKGMLSQRGLL